MNKSQFDIAFFRLFLDAAINIQPSVVNYKTLFRTDKWYTTTDIKIIFPKSAEGVNRGRKMAAHKDYFYQSREIILLFSGRGLHRFLLSHNPVYFNLYNKRSQLGLSIVRFQSSM